MKKNAKIGQQPCCITYQHHGKFSGWNIFDIGCVNIINIITDFLKTISRNPAVKLPPITSIQLADPDTVLNINDNKSLWQRREEWSNWSLREDTIKKFKIFKMFNHGNKLIVSSRSLPTVIKRTFGVGNKNLSSLLFYFQIWSGHSVPLPNWSLDGWQEMLLLKLVMGCCYWPR